MQRVAEVVASEYGVTVATLRGADRTRRAVRARWAAVLLMSSQGRKAASEIGRFLGRDHTTILHGLSSAEGLSEDGDWRAAFLRCERRINGAPVFVRHGAAVPDWARGVAA